MALLDRPRVRSTDEPSTRFEHCELCAQWRESMELKRVVIDDPLVPGRRLDVRACEKCRERWSK